MVGFLEPRMNTHEALIPVLQPAIYSKTPRLLISAYQCPSVVGFFRTADEHS